jgi:hypothetical protein
MNGRPTIFASFGHVAVASGWDHFSPSNDGSWTPCRRPIRGAHYTRDMAEASPHAALHHGDTGSGSAGDSADHHQNNSGGVKAPPLLQGNQWK